MAESEGEEIKHLLRNEDNADDTVSDSKKQLSLPYAVYIMVATMFGTTIVVHPYIAKMFGLFAWFLIVTSCLVMAAFCSVLLKDVIVYSSKKIESLALFRDPYVQVSEIVVGKRFARLVQVTLYIVMVLIVLGCQLIAATNLVNIIPVNLEYYNRVRVWLLVCYLIQLPFSLRGTTKDSGSPGLIAFVLSIFSACSIQLLCGVAHFYYKVDSSYVLNSPRLPSPQTKEFITFFKLIGECWFTALGISLLLPNIIVIAKKPKSFEYPILCSYCILFILYAVSGVVPYLVFGDNVDENVLDTLNKVVVAYKMSPVWVTLLTMVEISLSAHFIIVSDLLIKPVFLSLEQRYDMSTGMLLSF